MSLGLVGPEFRAPFEGPGMTLILKYYLGPLPGRAFAGVSELVLVWRCCVWCVLRLNRDVGSKDTHHLTAP